MKNWNWYKVKGHDGLRFSYILASCITDAEKHAMEHHGVLGDAFRVPEDVLTPQMKELLAQQREKEIAEADKDKAPAGSDNPVVGPEV